MVCDKLSEVDSDTMPSNSIVRGGNRLNHYDHISSFAEEGTNYSAMQRYIEPIRRFLKAVNSLIGRLSSTAIAILPAPLQYRALQRQQILELAEKQNFHARIVLSEEVRAEIQWWIENLMLSKGKAISQPPQLVITSDASVQRWGAACLGQTTGGPWTLEEQKNHINILELKAAQLAILTFTYIHPQVHSIHLPTDNMVALSYIVKMGRTYNKVLSDISKEIWEYLLSKGITITV